MAAFWSLEKSGSEIYLSINGGGGGAVSIENGEDPAIVWGDNGQ